MSRHPRLELDESILWPDLAPPPGRTTPCGCGKNSAHTPRTRRSHSPMPPEVTLAASELSRIDRSSQRLRPTGATLLVGGPRRRGGPPVPLDKVPSESCVVLSTEPDVAKINVEPGNTGAISLIRNAYRALDILRQLLDWMGTLKQTLQRAAVWGYEWGGWSLKRAEGDYSETKRLSALAWVEEVMNGFVGTSNGGKNIGLVSAYRLELLPKAPCPPSTSLVGRRIDLCSGFFLKSKVTQRAHLIRTIASGEGIGSAKKSLVASAKFSIDGTCVWPREVPSFQVQKAYIGPTGPLDDDDAKPNKTLKKCTPSRFSARCYILATDCKGETFPVTHKDMVKDALWNAYLRIDPAKRMIDLMVESDNEDYRKYLWDFNPVPGDNRFDPSMKGWFGDYEKQSLGVLWNVVRHSWARYWDYPHLFRCQTGAATNAAAWYTGGTVHLSHDWLHNRTPSQRWHVVLHELLHFASPNFINLPRDLKVDVCSGGSAWQGSGKNVCYGEENAEKLVGLSAKKTVYFHGGAPAFDAVLAVLNLDNYTSWMENRFRAFGTLTLDDIPDNNDHIPSGLCALPPGALSFEDWLDG